jgi:hypothetical protein
MGKRLPETCGADSKINKIVIVASIWSFILFVYIVHSFCLNYAVKGNTSGKMLLNIKKCHLYVKSLFKSIILTDKHNGADLFFFQHYYMFRLATSAEICSSAE